MFIFLNRSALHYSAIKAWQNDGGQNDENDEDIRQDVFGVHFDRAS